MQKTEQIYQRLFFLVFLVGVGLRMFTYLKMPALWLDEAFTANRLLSMPLKSLVLPVNGCIECMHNYPVGFLFLCKLSIFLIKIPELSLRLAPLVCSLLGLGLFAKVARRIFNPVLALLSFSIFSIAAPLIYHGVEVKPYSSDVFISVWLLWIAISVVEKKGHLRIWNFYIITVVSILSSFTSMFLIFPYLGIWVLAGIWKRLDKKIILPRIGMLVFAAAVQGAYYLLSLRFFYKDSHFMGMWDEQFLPVLKGVSASAHMLWINFADIFSGWGISTGFGMLCLILGFVVMWIREKKHFVLFALPLFAVLTASALHIYPFFERTVHFLTPFFIIILIYAVQFFYDRRQFRVYAGILWVSVALMLIPIGIKSFLLIRNFSYGEDIRPLVTEIGKNRRSGEGLYLSKLSIPGFVFYSTNYGFPVDYSGTFDVKASIINGEPSLILAFTPFEEKIAYFISADAGYFKANDEGAHFIQPGRNWFLFTHTKHTEVKKTILKFLDSVGTLVSVVKGDEDAYLYLYNIERRPIMTDAHLTTQ